MTLARELAGWAAGLEPDDVPARVRAYARSQILSSMAGAAAALRHPLGERIRRAWGSPLDPDAARAAYVLSALTMALELDEAVYAGHVSHSTVNVPLAYARARGLDGRELLTAVIAANECAARVAAAATIGPLRGQMAAHTHLAGAVAGRMRAERAPTDRWVSALGLAFGAPPWPLARAFVASDAKLMTAAAAVGAALDACDAAAAGLAGADDVLEHEAGFLARFADVPLPDALVAGLGSRWHTETLTFKLHPVSTGGGAAVECAAELHAALSGADLAAVEEVVVHGSLFTVGSNAEALPAARGPDAPVSALQYSIPYVVATALLTGDLTPADYAAPAVEDEARRRLAERVRVEHDEALTRRAVLATAPVGEALRQAGDRAAPWLERAGAAGERTLAELGEPGETFQHAEKAIGARVVVRLGDGRELVAERSAPTGAAGEDTRARHPELAREKFLRCGGPPEAADVAAELEDAGPGDVARMIETTLRAGAGRGDRGDRGAATPDVGVFPRSPAGRAAAGA